MKEHWQHLNRSILGLSVQRYAFFYYTNIFLLDEGYVECRCTDSHKSYIQFVKKIIIRTQTYKNSELMYM